MALQQMKAAEMYLGSRRSEADKRWRRVLLMETTSE